MMKQTLLLLLTALSLSVSAQQEAAYIEGQLIIQLQKDKYPEVLQEMFPKAEIQASRLLSRQMNIWLIEIKPTINHDKLLDRLNELPIVKAAQLNHVVQKRSLIPNDQFFHEQWNMYNDGSHPNSTVEADIDANDAWARDTPKTVTALGDTMVVAVIDGRFQKHEDLNFFTNWAEIPNNSIDDDGNGFIDDYDGWNPYNSTDNVFGSGGFVDHANHVSGIVGAKGNDTVGVAGVHWGVKILPINGDAQNEAIVVTAYDYVLEMRKLYESTNGAAGAFIVATNASFGVDFGKADDFPIWCSMYDELGAYGILSSAATINLNINVDNEGDIPTTCASEFLISLNNTNKNDQRNGGSGFGPVSIDLGAPGTSVYSTERAGQWDAQTGTSMSAPHVAGAVSYLLSTGDSVFQQAYIDKPDSIAKLIRDYILDGVDHLPTQVGKVVTAGRLNLYRSLLLMKEETQDCGIPFTTTVDQIDCAGVDAGSITLNPSVPISSLTIAWSTGDTGMTTLSGLEPGYYSAVISNDTCYEIFEIELEANEPLGFASFSIGFGSNNGNGSIAVAGSGGDGNYEYSIDNVNFGSLGTFTSLGTGNYQVYVRDGNGCVHDTTYTFTGIEQAGLENAFPILLYPNPANDKINLKYVLEQNSQVQIKAFNTLGSLVMSKSEEAQTGENHHVLDVTEFSSGWYMLHIETAGYSRSLKFLIR